MRKNMGFSSVNICGALVILVHICHRSIFLPVCTTKSYSPLRMHFQFEFWLEKTKMPFKWSKRVYPTLNICNSMHFQRVTTNVPEFVDPFLSLSDLLFAMQQPRQIQISPQHRSNRTPLLRVRFEMPGTNHCCAI